MSQENVPQDRRAQAEVLFAALNARDFEALADFPFDPAMELRSVLAIADGGVYRGIQGLREWASDVDAVFDDYCGKILQFREVDDERAVAVVRVTGKAKASGIPLDVRTGQVWTWRHGLMWRNEVYTDVREAFEAVGLSE